MVYDYECNHCGHSCVVEKPISRSSTSEQCTKCGENMHKLPSRFYHHGASVENAYFNHGLGCVVDNSRHAQQIAKSRGLVEIGNDSLESITPPQVDPRSYDKVDYFDKLVTRSFS